MGGGGGAKDADGNPLVFHVQRFIEKPDAVRAQAYYESGEFGWNSGMFVFHAGAFLECLQRYEPQSHEGLMTIAEAWGTKRQSEVLRAVYPTLPKISVDYAVMEPASREDASKIVTVNMDVEWLDVGSWPSFGQTLDADKAGNRLSPGTRAVLEKCSNCLVVSDDPSHTIAMLGCKELIVVRTRDATLVMPRDKAEQLKSLHERLDESLA